MSGLEAVAGLAIGVLPLLISAVEHYKSVCRPFRRWKNFHKELKRFHTQLLVEDATFQNECLMLLGSLIGNIDAGEMLQDPGHPLWLDPALEAKMASYLGSSMDAWGQLIELIKFKLDEVKEKSSKFDRVINGCKETEKRSADGWRRKIGRKLDFSISGPALNDDLSELRIHNQNLHRFSDQLRQLYLQTNAGTSGILPQGFGQLDVKDTVVLRKENFPSSTTPVDQCRLIQKAAIKLYNSLVNACKLHPEHSACFRLDSSQSKGSQLVRFDMTLRHILDKEVVDEDPIWFAVESVLKECMEKAAPGIQTEAVEGAWSEFTNTRKRLNPSPPPIVEKKAKRHKTVSFADDLCVSTNVVGVGEALPNLSQHRDFCKQFRRCCMQKPTLGRCLGYLDKTEVCDHRVVFSPTSAKSRNPTSLAYLISTWSNRKYGQGILIYEGLCLAKQLASAVLQFHATPLLNEDWASKDVVFFDMENLKAPHLSVRIQTKTPETRIAENSNARDRLVRNPYTFTLGLIMIELGYQAPLQSLKRITSLDGSEDMANSYDLADSVSEDMSTQLGVAYKRMVQQCIRCDFGAGSDLTDPKLQAAFHRDIVCGLESLERRFEDLQING